MMLYLYRKVEGRKEKKQEDRNWINIESLETFDSSIKCFFEPSESARDISRIREFRTTVYTFVARGRDARVRVAFYACWPSVQNRVEKGAKRGREWVDAVGGSILK